MGEAFSKYTKDVRKIRFVIVTPKYLLPKVHEYVLSAFTACLEENDLANKLPRIELSTIYYPVSVARTRWEKFVEQCKIIWNIIV